VCMNFEGKYQAGRRGEAAKIVLSNAFDKSLIMRW
jgi:hypothetical protein